MTSVLDQAQNFSGGVVSAARKRESWLRRAANATDPEVAAQYEEAAADLAARYPDIEDLGIGEAERFARERGHGTKSRSPVHEGRSRSRPGTTRRSSSKPATTSTRDGSRGPASRRVDRAATRRTGPRPTPQVDRAIRETGIPAAAGEGRSAVMMGLGATVGLSLLFLLLSSAEEAGTGGAALPRLIGSVTGFISRFLSVRDFFPSNDPKGQVLHGRGPGGKTHTLRYQGAQTVATAAARLKAMEEQRKHGSKGKR